jgi:hypothetical protein
MHALLAGTLARRAHAQLRLGRRCARGAHVGVVERGGALGGLAGVAARGGALAALCGHRLHQPRRRRLRARADGASAARAGTQPRPSLHAHAAPGSEQARNGSTHSERICAPTRPARR